MTCSAFESFTIDRTSVKLAQGNARLSSHQLAENRTTCSAVRTADCYINARAHHAQDARLKGDKPETQEAASDKPETQEAASPPLKKNILSSEVQ